MKNKHVFLRLLLVAGLAVSGLQAAQPGKELQVNTFTAGHQWYHSVAMNEKGNFVVVWESVDQDKSQGGVFAQRFNKAGKRLGNEFQVNSYSESNQGSPAVAMDKKGNFVVVWESWAQDGSGYGIFMRKYNKFGKPTGKELQVNTNSSGDQLFPAVVMNGSGSFVVAWSSKGQDGDHYGVYARRFKKNGKPAGTEFQVNTYTKDRQWLPQVGMDKKGNFVIVWESEGQDKSEGGVFAQRFDKHGKPVGAEFQVNFRTKRNQGTPAVVMGEKGNYVIVWESWNQDGNKYGVFARRYNRSGKALGKEFLVNTYTTLDQWFPQIAMSSKGGFVIVWESEEQDKSQGGVFAQMFDLNGVPDGNEIQVNTYTQGNQGSPAVAIDKKGNFVVVWESWAQDGDSYGVFAKTFKK